MYRSCIIAMYTQNLYDSVNQYHRNKFNFKKPHRLRHQYSDYQREKEVRQVEKGKEEDKC